MYRQTSLYIHFFESFARASSSAIGSCGVLLFLIAFADRRSVSIPVLSYSILLFPWFGPWLGMLPLNLVSCHLNIWWDGPPSVKKIYIPWVQVALKVVLNIQLLFLKQWLEVTVGLGKVAWPVHEIVTIIPPLKSHDHNSGLGDKLTFMILQHLVVIGLQCVTFPANLTSKVNWQDIVA